MQTDLRGRDLISDLDFSKEEVESVLDAVFLFKYTYPRFLRSRDGATRRSRRFHRITNDADFAWRHRKRNGPHIWSLLRWHCHPPCRVGGRQPLSELGRRGFPGTGVEYAM